MSGKAYSKKTAKAEAVLKSSGLDATVPDVMRPELFCGVELVNHTSDYQEIF